MSEGDKGNTARDREDWEREIGEGDRETRGIRLGEREKGGRGGAREQGSEG